MPFAKEKASSHMPSLGATEQAPNLRARNKPEASNRVHADYGSMVQSAAEALGETFADIKRIKTICNAPYLRRAI
jgi:hypothetical protein